MKKVIKDIMTSPVHVIHPESSLKDAAKVMDDEDVGVLAGCDGDRLVGIISDRDIVCRSISAGQDPNLTLVRDAMTSPIIYCFEDQDVGGVAALMKEKQIRRIPVLTRNKRLCGIVSLGDLATGTRDERLSGGTLEQVSKEKPAAA